MKRRQSMTALSRITLVLFFMGHGMAGHALASDGQDHLTPVPDEVKQHILGHVSPKDLGAVSGVSKHLREHASDDRLWRQKAAALGLVIKPEGMTWKQVFIANA